MARYRFYGDEPISSLIVRRAPAAYVAEWFLTLHQITGLATATVRNGR